MRTKNSRRLLTVFSLSLFVAEKTTARQAHAVTVSLSETEKKETIPLPLLCFV